MDENFLNMPFDPTLGGKDILPTSFDTKFKGEQDPRHGGVLSWPGIEGIPFRGPVVDLKEEERNRLVLVNDFKCQTFDLSQPEDKEYYNWVMDRICNGLFKCLYINRMWSNEHKTMLVYVEWVQSYYEHRDK